jgi:hypothetical protein
VRALLATALLALAIAGCQRAPAPSASASTPVETVGSLTERLKSEGDVLMTQQRYEEAAVKYQAALNQAPDDIAIRYALAVALSHTSQREETVTQFRLVVQRGTPGSPEVKAAREWLAKAGEIDASQPAVAGSDSPESADPKKGRVYGKIRWNDITPQQKRVAITVNLIGDAVETRDVRMGRPDFKIGRNYEFRNVPPGAYRLVAEAAGTPMWDLKVEVAAEKLTTLDLTEGNASVAKDFEPQSND